METFTVNCKNYHDSKSPEALKSVLKEIIEKLESVKKKPLNTFVTKFCDEIIKELLTAPRKDFDEDSVNYMNKIIGISVVCKDFAILSDLYLPFLAESLNSDHENVIISALQAESQIIKENATTLDELVKYNILDKNRNFFNRKVDLSVLKQAALTMVDLSTMRPSDQVFTSLIEGLHYCITHINFEIIDLAVKTVINFINDNSEMADIFIKNFFYDDVYAQFRQPSNEIKAVILQLFTKTVILGPRFQKFVREHTISERISAFLCHYNDTVCMNCIELLDVLDFSVKTCIEYKYIITLILHISMSEFKFKKKSFDLLEKYLYKADASQVRTISDEGYIRPFLTLACEQQLFTSDKERILDLMKYLIEKFDILNIRIVQFDFDHAHNKEEFSCVNQLIQLMEDGSSNLKINASYILDRLSKIGIVNNMAN